MSGFLISGCHCIIFYLIVTIGGSTATGALVVVSVHSCGGTHLAVVTLWVAGAFWVCLDGHQSWKFAI